VGAAHLFRDEIMGSADPTGQGRYRATEVGSMATAEQLMGVLGSPVESDAVCSLIVADKLIESTHPDLEEGEPVSSYLASTRDGYELLCEDGRVIAAFLLVEATHGCESFMGTLPGGLSASDTRQDVLRRFGAPERSGEAFSHQILGRSGAWDRFMVGPVCFHFQYTEPEERIRQVTLMVASRAP
jgi:hypothetical protein